MTTHYVYLLRCADATLYTGYTTNVDSRLAAHNEGKGARYTRGRTPVALLAAWDFASRREALHVEQYLKTLRRARKLELISLPVDSISLQALAAKQKARTSPK